MKAKGGSQQYCSCDNKFLFGICNCTAESDTGTGDLLSMLGILHMCVSSKHQKLLSFWLQRSPGILNKIGKKGMDS